MAGASAEPKASSWQGQPSESPVACPCMAVTSGPVKGVGLPPRACVPRPFSVGGSL